jgi:hypothetical protein
MSLCSRAVTVVDVKTTNVRLNVEVAERAGPITSTVDSPYGDTPVTGGIARVCRGAFDHIHENGCQGYLGGPIDATIRRFKNSSDVPYHIICIYSEVIYAVYAFVIKTRFKMATATGVLV